jgi:hypothetical protein
MEFSYRKKWHWELATPISLLHSSLGLLPRVHVPKPRTFWDPLNSGTKTINLSAIGCSIEKSEVIDGSDFLSKSLRIP